MTKIGVEETSFFKDSISKYGSAKIDFTESNLSEPGTSKVDPLHITVPKTTFVHTNSSEVSKAQVNFSKGSPIELGFAEVGFPVNSTLDTLVSQPPETLSSEIFFAPSVSSEQFVSIHNSTPKITNVLNNTATNIWSDLLQTETQLNVNFQITDLPKGQLAEATITGFNDSGVPNAGTIAIDHNANGVGWFIDPTPLNNSEFTPQNTDSYLLATAESEAEGKYDLLSTVLHELAHLYGFIDGYEGFDARVETEDGTTKFIGDDFERGSASRLPRQAQVSFEAVLDGEHLDKQAHPYDLLNTHLVPGIRKLPSELDVEILQALIATELEQNDSNPAGEELLASLTSDPLLAIANGDFSISDTTTDSFAWNTRGASGIEDGQAVLTEDSPFLSNFTQTFTVPESAKTIQFKLIGAELGASELFPPDAFEVALLDADTNESLTSVSDLSNTDSLLNIQNDGTVYFSDKVRIGGATSGEIIGLDRPRTVTVDISDLTPGTEATLYFDLLGFGDADSRVVIDDVRLSDQFLLPPVANDDTATVTQGEIVEIDILANDTDDDGTLDPDSVEIQTEPANGTATVNNDGTVSYTPSDRTIGEDSFTYVVQDNDEQQSETASVNVTVENAIPVISEVQIPDTITEGVEVTLGVIGEATALWAIASDAGNDKLTYSWTIDGEALTENNSQINYTFADNGVYTGSVTVTDTHGGSDTQTFEVTVENAVPVVNAGSDVTVDEGSSVEFTGSYSDTGTNDTHTVSWDFGDGDTADTSEVSHTYTDDGEYTATYTVTDNDGATASGTVEVTVNNVAPIIESLTGNTEINEGDIATFNAIATDPGDDTITYIWDFGDGSEQLSVSAEQLPVEHIYRNNGDYTVTLTVRDEDGGETLSTLDVRVNNVAPTFDAVNGATIVDEGEAVNYSAIASDPGDDELTYSWNFGDGTPEATGADVLKDTASHITHTFANNGIYDATVTVTDDDDASTVYNLTITVNNVAPTVETESSGTGEEGSAVTMTATFGDSGNDDLTVTWDFGDGSDTVTTNYPAGSDINLEIQTHTYADNGTYIATVTITDSDGASTESEIEVAIANTAPVIESITGDTVVNEGDTATFNAIAIDPGDDTITYIWDFGDGSEQLIANSSQLPISHVYADNGDYTVTLTVRDEDDGETLSTLDVRVNNVAPTFTEVNGETEVNEGEVVNYSATATDSGDDELTYTWSFDGGTSQVDMADVNHIFAQDGTYDATVTVTDDDGASTTRTLSVNVNNVAPSIETDDSRTGSEGSAVEFNATISDPGTDALTITWDFGDGSDPVTSDYNESPTPYEATTSHIYTQNGVYTATVTVIDSDGAVSSSEVEVTVSNVVPVIESLTGDTEINEGDTATFNAIATDAGNDELTYSWDFGDGSEPLVVVDDANPVEHTYADNGDYTVTLTVRDENGAEAVQTHEIAVNNTVPVITSLTGDPRVDEGDTASFSVSASDAGDDTLAYVWDFGDGSDTVMGENAEHIFADNGLYETTVTVSDDDGASVTQSLTITVDNVAPIADPWIDEQSTEGDTVEFNVSFSDPGRLDTHTLTWDFGDGSEPVTTEGTQTSISHVYSDNGIYTASVVITDSDGASTTNTMTVTVNNAAPAIDSLTGDRSVDEGKIANFRVAASDPGADELTYSWDFGERPRADERRKGTRELGDGSTATGTDVAHTFTQNGSYTVTATVTDDDGASTTSTLEVTVNNVTPKIESLTGDRSVDEGTPATFNAIATDPGNDTLTYTWDFGDGSERVAGVDRSSAEHTYTDEGDYNVTLTVTDSDGASTSQSLAVAVNNVAPVITQVTGDTRIDEGGRANFNATATDVGNDELTYTWNLGNGNLDKGQSVEDIYLDNGVYEITLTVTDGDGGTASSNLTITVDNVAPEIAPLEDRNSDEGQAVEFNFSFNDPGILDTHTVVWDFGDGTQPQVLDNDATSISHTYTDNGEYTATLTVTDNDGASKIETVNVTVSNVTPTFTQVNGRTNVDEGEVVNYSATASDPGEDELTYTWSFNNGASEVELANVNHIFAQDGNYDAIVTVTDDDGASTSTTLEVTVNNVAPNIETGITQTGDEGSAVEFAATFSDPGTDALTITWDFGDGTEPVTTNYDDSPTPFELTQAHTYATDGIYNATVTVTDSDGAVTNSNVEVTINNVAPTIESVAGDTAINEGDTGTYSAIASDPGADELTYSWDFGDGTEPVDLVNDSSPVSHTYTDNGEYTVSLTVTDPSGASDTRSLSVMVNNVAPTITKAVGDTPINEGSTANLNATATDPGDDTITYTWSFPDGTELTGEAVSKTFVESGEYSVNLTARDEDGGSSSRTLTIEVNNVAPIVDALSDRTSDEGSPVAFNASKSDPGILDTHTIEWSFGDGATATDTLTPTHTYTDNGEYEVALTVTDDEEAATTVELTVAVNNVAPTITQATGDTPVDEGSVANFSASATDPGDDTLSYTWNFGDGSEPQTGESVAHTYADDGEYDVTLSVTDDDGGVTTQNLSVVVDNVAPILERVEFAPPAEGRTSQFRAIATDPGDDTLTYTWNFGDASEPVTGSTVEHLYTDDGDYTITLTARDEDGGTTTSSFAVAVERVFNLKAEGKIRINGRSDLDGEPLNVDDDTRIYAGSGFTINGSQTLPVQRDSNGNDIKQGRKSVLVDQAITVGPNYSESNANASRNKYVGIVPPQVIDELTVNVTQHTALIDVELANRVAPGTTAVTFDPQRNSLNNARDWENKFPAPGTAERPTVVTISNGSLNIPDGVKLSNYVIRVEQGDIKFNGKGHDLDNVVLINRNGSINLAEVRSNNLSVFAANNININSNARFGGDTVIATGNSNSNLNFNGATSTLDNSSNLQVISQGNIIFNSSSTTKGNFIAGRDFTANGRSDIIGSIQTKGDIRINGGINLQSE